MITLIKKVGGLDELEKQLQMRLKLNQVSTASRVGIDEKTTTTTTVSPISKSLYNKVIESKRSQLREQKVVSSSTDRIEPLVQRQNKENRYSAVNRNSQPRPQNDGLDQMSDTDEDEVIRERPKYTTITRTHPPKVQKEEEEEEQTVTVASNDEDSEEEEEEEEAPKNPTTHQPIHQYVTIQRTRPSTTAPPAEEDEESDVEEVVEEDDEEVPAKVVPTTTPKMQYVNIQRIRPTKPQYILDEVESESPAPEIK